MNSIEGTEVELRPGWHHADWYYVTVLLCLVTLGWCLAYNRRTVKAWAVPLEYSGDALASMATAKMFSTGELLPVLPKNPPSFGAPFVANRNDYPITEEGIFIWHGLLIRCFGVFAGSNLAILSASLLAAGSFYFVGRTLGYREELTLAGAALFSLSHYAFSRGLAHSGLTFYWHVPLGLLVIWWCCRANPRPLSQSKIFICGMTAVLHGIQHPYYTGIFGQFLIFAGIVCLMRNDSWRRVALPLSLAALTVAIFLVMNYDTFVYRADHGPNPAAVARNYAGLELYALKPLTLLLPFPHRLDALAAWCKEHYFVKTNSPSEHGTSYLGVVGLAGLGLLVWMTARSAITQRTRIPSHFWMILWIFAYSVVGGMNGFLGLFGLNFFRGTNRYSIVILAVVLLFLVRTLTFLTRTWRQTSISALSCALTLFGVWDQSPAPVSSARIDQVRDIIQADASFVTAMELALPPKAMVFELPVCDFPEVPPRFEMADYEHFRLYLHSQTLRYSYGSDKGRARELWQREVEMLPPIHLVESLEQFGFSALLINKRGYADHAAALLKALKATGRETLDPGQSDFACIFLQPSLRPILPPEFGPPWYGLEIDEDQNRRWSAGDATVVLFNQEVRARLVRLAFGIESLQSGEVDIFLGTEMIRSLHLRAMEPSDRIVIDLQLVPGANKLYFMTDLVAMPPATGDQRPLAFSLRNFAISGLQ